MHECVAAFVRFLILEPMLNFETTEKATWVHFDIIFVAEVFRSEIYLLKILKITHLMLSKIIIFNWYLRCVLMIEHKSSSWTRATGSRLVIMVGGVWYRVCDPFPGPWPILHGSHAHATLTTLRLAFTLVPPPLHSSRNLSFILHPPSLSSTYIIQPLAHVLPLLQL